MMGWNYLGKMKALQKFHLSGNKIGAEGAKALAPALGKMTALEMLDFGYNKIGDGRLLLKDAWKEAGKPEGGLGL